MFKKLWLIFAQTATVCLGALFVIATLRPEWLQRGQANRPAVAGNPVAVLTQQVVPAATGAAALPAVGSYAEPVKRAQPAVVNIYTTKEMRRQHPLMNDPLFRRFFGDRFKQQDEPASSLGSGVIVSPQGYILTNNHVVEGADDIEVLLADGRRGKAKVIGLDPESDLAVIKVELPNLPAIVFGRDGEQRVGDVVLAIGNPFGVGQTVTMGIVSALGRTSLGINTFENFIQTDAAINPGNSGGALIDAQGNLIGINTAIYSRSGGSLGIGFAIPASMAKSIMEEIVATGQVTRGWIGVEIQEITPEIAESFKLPVKKGAIIAGVVRGGPSDKGGVRPGDVLLQVAGTPVGDSPTMLTAISKLKPGESARVKVLRQGKEMEFEIVAGKRPKPQPKQE
jgi:serine protease DegQ